MRRSFFLVLPLFVATACGPTSPDPGEDTGTVEVLTNPYGDAVNCPASFDTGTMTVLAGGLQRTLEVELPDEPEGAPVVLAWHWLNGDATQIMNWMGIRQLADAGYIVVAPESSGSQWEWDTVDSSTNNVDLALLDMLLPCLWESHHIDSDAVFATGHSAGGLFTTFLTMQRADVLAATAPFSGGTSAAGYDTPSQPIPVLVTWGGENDTYGNFSFDTSSTSFVSLLEADGSSPFPCEHSGGHVWPSETVSMLELFFADHRLGEASPWESGVPSAMPSFCQ